MDQVIPKSVQKMIGSGELTMDQKLIGFMMFMPKVPENAMVAKIVAHNLELGEKIKKLVDDNKITIGKFDKNFILDVKVN
ncbi:MAG: hypothetical protein HOI07_04980 [Betaproteobacteria bacterium]|jgi:hypothetical protein|nr:hypothetical protein [Betaproteobacteria bacterium]